MPRHDGRQPQQLRPVRITPGVLPYAEGSALIEMGHTRVLCAVSIEPGVPGWMRGQGRGWITGEYALLPRSTQTRTRRERNGAGGRTQEIQRLIGRSLRAGVDLTLLGERTVTVDCDVLVADGGTRTASVTGGYVALALALQQLRSRGEFANDPLICVVAAVSAGFVDGEALLDLDYYEDSRADVDCNIVQTNQGAFVEIQGTAEGAPIGRSQLDTLIDLASLGIVSLVEAQRTAIAAGTAH